ncbi:MAG: hypothetical protein NT040_09590 [Bacteroidetes bacterium]|nr:hypothetical protein [Bacteroidota bacterium]
MKIAIPSNDGLMLCHDFGHSRGFLVLTVELGEIIREEMRWNKLSDILCSDDGLLAPIHDCQIVLADAIGNSSKALLAGKNIAVTHTSESIITNAFLQYKENTLRREANTCCCP